MIATELSEYIRVVLSQYYTVQCGSTLLFLSLWKQKFNSVTIQMKATEQYLDKTVEKREGEGRGNRCKVYAFSESLRV